MSPKKRADRYVWGKEDLIKMPATPEESEALFDDEEKAFLEEATEEELEEAERQ